MIFTRAIEGVLPLSVGYTTPALHYKTRPKRSFRSERPARHARDAPVAASSRRGLPPLLYVDHVRRQARTTTPTWASNSEGRPATMSRCIEAVACSGEASMSASDRTTASSATADPARTGYVEDLDHRAFEQCPGLWQRAHDSYRRPGNRADPAERAYEEQFLPERRADVVRDRRPAHLIARRRRATVRGGHCGGAVEFAEGDERQRPSRCGSARVPPRRSEEAAEPSGHVIPATEG